MSSQKGFINEEKQSENRSDSHEVSKEQLMEARLAPDGSKSAIDGKVKTKGKVAK